MQLLTLIVLIMSAVLLSALISPYIPKVSLPPGPDRPGGHLVLPPLYTKPES